LYDRGGRLLSTLGAVGISVKGRRVADLGSGFGSTAIAAATAGAAHVVAVDADAERVRETRRRAERANVTVDVLQANLVDPPGDLPTVDIAFLVGVVEYAGLWDTHRPVRDLQVRVLKTAHRMLDAGGVLIFASKNRLWPRFALQDPHTGTPFVNVLPRRWANALSRRVNDRLYRHWIHSPRGWARLMDDAGFSRATLYYPYYSYQFPLALAQRPSLRLLRTLRDRVANEDEAAIALGRLWLPKGLLMAISTAAGVPLTHSVLIKAEK
jgi:SAM-dependent methyltransferase